MTGRMEEVHTGDGAMLILSFRTTIDLLGTASVVDKICPKTQFSPGRENSTTFLLSGHYFALSRMRFAGVTLNPKPRTPSAHVELLPYHTDPGLPKH